MPISTDYGDDQYAMRKPQAAPVQAGASVPPPGKAMRSPLAKAFGKKTGRKGEPPAPIGTPGQ